VFIVFEELDFVKQGLGLWTVGYVQSFDSDKHAEVLNVLTHCSEVNRALTTPSDNIVKSIAAWNFVIFQIRKPDKCLFSELCD